MLLLQEDTRRWMCRWSWLLLGLLPTCVTLAYSLQNLTGLSRNAAAGELTALLGWQTTCREVRRLLPDKAEYLDVRCIDPESGICVAEISRLTLHKAGNLWLANIPRATLRWHATADWRVLLFDGPPRTKTLSSRVILAIDNLTIQNAGKRELNLEQVLIRQEQTSDGGLWHLTTGTGPTRTPGVDIALRQPVRATAENTGDQALTRERELTANSSRLPLPLSLCGSELAEMLGPAATFTGKVELRHGRDGWSGTIRGSLEEIDLATAVGEPFAQRLTGRATLLLDELRLERGRIQSASLGVRASIEQMHSQLAASLAATLHGSLARGADPGRVILENVICDAQIRLRPGRLQVRGMLPRGGILADANGQILAEPAGPLAEPGLLIKALAPPDMPLVPILPATAAWLARLPQAAQETRQ
ncbi:MAG: hypothetical protein SFX18_11605 [Pirellulales bacterium]|nr:hypothetical protein [Pirellulales bacterium]